MARYLHAARKCLVSYRPVAILTVTIVVMVLAIHNEGRSAQQVLEFFQNVYIFARALGSFMRCPLAWEGPGTRRGTTQI